MRRRVRHDKSTFTYILHSTKGRVKPIYHGNVCNEIPNRDLENMRFSSERSNGKLEMLNKKLVVHSLKKIK